MASVPRPRVQSAPLGSVCVCVCVCVCARPRTHVHSRTCSQVPARPALGWGEDPAAIRTGHRQAQPSSRASRARGGPSADGRREWGSGADGKPASGQEGLCGRGAWAGTHAKGRGGTWVEPLAEGGKAALAKALRQQGADALWGLKEEGGVRVGLLRRAVCSPDGRREAGRRPKPPSTAPLPRPHGSGCPPPSAAAPDKRGAGGLWLFLSSPRGGGPCGFILESRILDPALLRLWCRPVAAAPIRPLARELP